jgi:cytidine deaminase
MHDLVEAAREALTDAYMPYSNYAVGAALQTTGGTVHTGCNIEVANISNTVHAEELAVAKAVTEGHTEFAILAITSSAQEGNPPCGMCRQTLAEFCVADFTILVDEGERVAEYTLGEILPDAIAESDLQAEF